jgi:hypothetical protein
MYILLLSGSIEKYSVFQVAGLTTRGSCVQVFFFFVRRLVNYVVIADDGGESCEQIRFDFLVVSTTSATRFCQYMTFNLNIYHISSKFQRHENRNMSSEICITIK